MTSRNSPWEGTDVIGQEVRNLPVDLNDDEVLQRGRELALQLRAIAQLENEHKEALAALKAEQRADLSAAKLELERLQTAVNDGKEPRPVACVELADFGRGIAHTVRTDTAETVTTRRLRKDEVQVTIGVPLRVVPDPTTGRIVRADGRGLDTLPFVRPEHCAPLRCEECDALHGRVHAEECDLRGLGDARLVQRDQCNPQRCLECDAALSERHTETCPHANS